MKSTLTIIFSLFTFFVLAQPSGNIEEDTARANRLFAEAADMDDENPNKVPYLESIIEIYEKYNQIESLIEAKGHLAYYFVSLEDSLTRIFAMESIDLAEKYFKNDLHPSLMYSYIALQLTYGSRTHEKSIFYGKKAYQLVEKLSPEYFMVTTSLISDYMWLYEIEKGFSLMDEMEEYLNRTNDPKLQRYWTNFCYNKVMYNRVVLNHENVITYGKKFISENEIHKEFKGAAIAVIYSYISIAYKDLKNFPEAIKWDEKALKQAAAHLPKGSPILGVYYATSGSVYRDYKRYDEAIQAYTTGIELMSNDKLNYAHSIGNTLQNMTICYIRSKDYNAAEQTLLKAYEYSNNPMYLDATYADVLHLKNEYTKALELGHNALLAFSTNFQNKDVETLPSKYEEFKDNNWAGSILLKKAIILSDLGIEKQSAKYLQLSIEHSELAINTFNKLQEQLSGYEATRMSIHPKNIKALNVLYDTYYQYHKLQPTKITTDDIFQIAERKKAILLLESLTPNPLPQEYAQREEALVKNMRKLEQKTNIVEKDSIDYYQNLYFEARQNMEVFFEEVTTKFPKEVANFYNLNYATTTNIQTFLEDKTILVSYVTTANKHYIQTITKTDKNIKPLDVDEAFFDKINQLNTLLQNPFLIQNTNRDKFINLSHELYQILIAPIAKELGDKKKLIIIPEGKLFEIPFEVLLASNEKKPFHQLDFLIKDFDISYQYSATIYHQLKQKQAIKDNSFLGFAPVFENGQTIDMASRAADFIVDSLYRSIDNEQFVSLPNTEKEITEIKKIIETKNGQTTTLLKANANKSNYLSTIKSKPHQFVHIATHGIVNFQDPKLSALVCYDNENDVEKALLFANEIQMQDIQADLVVLSSCESGIGQLVAGEGLIALNRSFIYSGANNVMFSLWKVNDEYTSELMIDFYKFYYQNPTYTSALRQTKLKMLQNPITANPRFWAAFVLIGE